MLTSGFKRGFRHRIEVSPSSQWNVMLLARLYNNYRRSHKLHYNLPTAGEEASKGQDRTDIAYWQDWWEPASKTSAYYYWLKGLACLPTREAKRQALVQLATYDKQLTSCSSACFIFTASFASLPRGLPTLYYWKNVATMVWSFIVYWRQAGECNPAGCK